MQSVESGSSAQSSPSSSRQGLNWTMKGGGITFGVMVLVLIVALLFAANQNDVIGWLLVIISGGWLLLAVAVVLGVRRGAQSVSKQVKNMTASMAPRTEVQGQSAPAVDPMRDTKLDHSFKIVQVQTRVIQEELAQGAAADQDMVGRALETIEITAGNARDMIKASQDSSQHDSASRPDGAASSQRSRGSRAAQDEGPIQGEVIN
ncbi:MULTISPECIES: hypothetical protein [Micrococcus]|uniref:hypothetical protein n=1 Tax=Micrococcus TaxID=1269 RepID=UPI0023F79BEE|nr:hypothetical protein [Micrococcus terreus]MDK7700567.1 hypothetical protein [Micrococcus terreus]WOO97631.1 hypothetical protein R3I42_00105 [Micrococcus terreus]